MAARARTELDENLQKTENADNFDELQQDLKCQKRKLELNKQMHQRLNEYVEMIKTIDGIMPSLMQLLGSKSIYDVTETIKLLIFLYKNNIQSSEEGIKKMKALIWVKEKQIKEEVLRAYWMLFLDDQQYGHPGVAKNLLYLFQVRTTRPSARAPAASDGARLL